MAGKERGLFRMIFRDFIKSVTPRIPKRTLVGEDYFGTKYYETESAKDTIRKKTHRYFVPVNKQDFDQELPAEWEAWLRGRRAEPPTEAECIENYELIITKRKNAAELEAVYSKTTEIQILDPNAKPLDQHASLNYPVYDEYKNFGRGYKPKTSS